MKANVNDYVVLNDLDDAVIWQVVEVDKSATKLVDVEAVQISIKNNRRPPAAHWYTGGSEMPLTKVQASRLTELLRT